MTIVTRGFNIKTLVEEMSLAYLTPGYKKVIDEWIEQNRVLPTVRFLKEALTGNEEVYVRSDVIVDLYLKTASALFDLSKDEENHIGELRLPWNIKNGILVVDTEEGYHCEPWEIVGDYSQDVLYCSYDEEAMRQRWNQPGMLNAGLVSHADSSWDWFLENVRPKDDDIEGMLTFFVKLYGYWPTDLHTVVGGQDNLTEAEKQKIAAFDERAFVIRHARFSETNS